MITTIEPISNDVMSESSYSSRHDIDTRSVITDSLNPKINEVITEFIKLSKEMEITRKQIQKIGEEMLELKDRLEALERYQK